MEANALSLSLIFSHTVQYRAPLFQRPYVWSEKEQWELLWSDLAQLSDPASELQSVLPYFMGAVVLEQLESQTGAPGARAIIDGQQRLTTVQVLLVTLYDVCKKRFPEQFIVDDVEKLIFNTSREFEGSFHRFKLWPTNLDRKAYEAVMTAGAPAHLQLQSSGIQGTIADAYRYFYRMMDDWVAEKGEEGYAWLERLYRILAEKIRIVVIDMDQQDDAQTIFETMNARGTPLLPSDLVKNYLFKKLADENGHDPETVYENYWRSFDFENGLWRKEFKQGRLNRPALELFLQHYLVMAQSKEVAASNLFKEFRKYAEQSQQGAIDLLKSFNKYSKHFKAFLEAHDLKTQEGLFFHKLRTLDTSTLYPCLLWIYSSLDGKPEREKELKAILEVLESFLIRRMVCRLTTKNYNNLFLELLTTLKNENNCDADTIATFFKGKTKDTGRWPDDEEFRTSWLASSIFTNITRPRLRLVLAELDKALQLPKTESYDLNYDSLTVEHFLPGSWEEHWPIDETGKTAEEILKARNLRDVLKHSFGNLTFLTSSLNPAVSNGPFKRKKDEILKHTVLNLSRFLHTTQDWSEKDIIKRGAALYDLAKQIWPRT
ncbi:DUF262 domain-containing protein [Pseudodesulfovibrio indicus]|uniref:Uncharacterized protein with ParB-like and HNH nuclease domain n=1 Tax=Pseudodesulfovibrio indicus TaxID=1716143 RepID=A0AA94TJJ5_9BACT|nr:DUF262 domain-containing protein [Pseudodesulfovibrio indicus]TDT86828.1 uncharacterized protein with ParB-like and HNH nuclease domain [Pseudodesulfovibrio indicus]